jgi:hypothetical protein
MRLRFLALAFGSAALAACAGGAPTPPSLSYSLPALTAVTYVAGDTMSMDLDAGGQTFYVDRGESSTLGTTFARAQDGVQVSMAVKRFSASQSNPMGDPAVADESGISGPLVFTLDRRGVASVVSQPEVTGTARSFFQPLSLAHTFFPRLPGRAVHAGDSWTDTIRYEGAQGEGKVTSTAVMTYTVMGDSSVAQRKLLKVALEGTTESMASGAVSGMDYTQKVSGSVKGWVLWDLQRALMTEMYGDTDAAGTMDVSAAPYPMSIHVRGQSRVRLNEER